MKKLTTLTLIGASTVALMAGAATTASAQQGRWYGNGGQWMNINARQEQLDRRIDQGIRRGEISRSEAVRLRAEFRDIARTEARYRSNGLSPRERADLDRRFDRLSNQIRLDRNDRQGWGYGWRR